MASRGTSTTWGQGGTAQRAVLRLEDGTEFIGRAFGAPREAEGEVVFTTGMVGYPQSLTDPSYHGQILVSTWPLMGNYGVPARGSDAWGLSRSFESDRMRISGLVVAELCDSPSHHASSERLGDWMAGEGVPGIEGIDTRALTMRLREQGVMRGSIGVEGGGGLPPLNPRPSVAAVSSATAREIGEGKGPRIALVDCGVKNNIIRCLLAEGARVILLPWDASFDEVDCDGILISNGPGDPKACSKTIASARRALSGSRPIFGICLGSQILALAAGADTYKLKYGHRGQNQPCVEAGTGRCYVTSQNHGYAVRPESLPPGWEVWFSNANDGSVEGIRSTEGPFSAVQFHPEGCPGPRDTEYLIASFVREVASGKGIVTAGTVTARGIA
ncbi:MAG: glutamine-hydrolyzing carbamoyl-phosphate synthase small subunit [Spirochaetota bacterium]